MAKSRMALVVAVMAASGIVTAAPASACGGNDVCDRINEVCRATVQTYCLR